MQAQCAACHGPARAEAGFRVDSYLATIGCLDDGRPATVQAPPALAPLAAVLERADHRTYLGAEDRAAVLRWLALGAPAGRGVHEAAFVDPRSPDSHGAFLRARRYRPMLAADDPARCATCHEGTGQAMSTAAAPGATACTTCHGEPEGVRACSTCHGTAGAAFPPRNSCFFPGDARGSHAAHVQPGPVRTVGLACATCHPTPTAPGDFALAHGDGVVEVWLDRGAAGNAATFDAATQQCAVACHAQGGARPKPAWGEAAMTCVDCHGSPPEGHLVGACSGCHAEANADGTSLRDPVLHLNGRVDLGDGSGTCSSCHGHSGDPWPTSGAHQAHAHPAAAAPVACATCHDVPGPGAPHPRGGPAAVRLSGLAASSARRPTYDAATKSCAGTYCHAGSGGAATVPRWDQGNSAVACGSCHAAPPPAPHVQLASCGGSSCHEGSTTGPNALSPAGAARHVDGRIDRGL